VAVPVISTIESIESIKVVDISPQETGLLPLDDRLRDAFSTTSVATQQEYNSIMAMANDPDFLSRPGGLFELQVRLGEYKQQMEVISALTRKGVATAETLLRA